MKEVIDALKHCSSTVDNAHQLAEWKVGRVVRSAPIETRPNDLTRVADIKRPHWVFAYKKSVFTFIAALIAISAVALQTYFANNIEFHYLAIPPTTIEHVQENLDDGSVGTTVNSAMVSAVLDLENVALVSADEIQRYDGSDLARAIAAGADTVLSSHLTCEVQSCQLRITEVETETKTVTNQRAFTLHTSELLAMQLSVKSQTLSLLERFSIKNNRQDLNLSEQDYRQYIYLKSQHVPRNLNPDLLAQMRIFQKRNPKFPLIYDVMTQYYLDAYMETGDAGYLNVAEEVLDRGRLRLPDDTNLQLNQIKVQIVSNKLDGIPANIKSLEQKGIDSVELEQLKARYWQKHGNFEEALAAADRVIEMRTSSFALFRKAQILWMLGNTSEARAYLQLALTLAPNYIPALGLLADTALIEGRAEEAVTRYQELIQYQDGSLNRANLGLSLFLLGDFVSAKQHLTRAYRNNPQSASYLINLADCEWLLNETDQALEHYQKVLQLIEDDAGRSNYLGLKAQALSLMNQPEAALLALKDALEQSPKNIDNLYAAARVYTAIGEYTSAVIYSKQAIDQGLSVKWFQLPWFEELKENQSFSNLVYSNNIP